MRWWIQRDNISIGLIVFLKPVYYNEIRYLKMTTGGNEYE